MISRVCVPLDHVSLWINLVSLGINLGIMCPCWTIPEDGSSDNEFAAILKYG
jgi:hypothetical protein